VASAHISKECPDGEVWRPVIGETYKSWVVRLWLELCVETLEGRKALRGEARVTVLNMLNKYSRLREIWRVSRTECHRIEENLASWS
jgi:hypothetical protein